ncbi:MAG: hypothetical protein ABSF25_16295 [Bryobacteraceae bacterium]|jgi:hypothetical protein
MEISLWKSEYSGLPGIQSKERQSRSVANFALGRSECGGIPSGFPQRIANYAFPNPAEKGACARFEEAILRAGFGKVES